jgi:hypothetical protein
MLSCTEGDTMRRFASALLVLPAILAGCGGSSGPIASGNPVATYPTLTGNWTVLATSNLTGATYLLGGSIANSEASVSATLQVLPFESGCLPTGEPITFTGAITSGGAISLASAAVANQTISISGSSLFGNTINGNYKITGGCAAGDSGTVLGAIIPSYAGAYTGTIQPYSGTQIGASMSLVQSGPSAGGEFNVSGTATFSGSSCFTTGTITSSVVLGEYIQITMSTDKGGTVQLTGLGTGPQVMTIVGTYQVTAGPCAGTVGSVSISS